jgi:NADH-quinone oxidoreductase subunit L
MTVNFTININELSALMLVLITLISAIVHLYSLGYMKNDANLAKFLSFLSLFTFFMTILVSADNFLQLFFGWEGVGLFSYLLIGFYNIKPEANDAAIKAFVTNRISDFAFILAIVMIIIYTGSVAFIDIFESNNIDKLSATAMNIMGTQCSILDIICLLLLIAAMGKSAQIGFHIWLPDAMEGPTPVSALIHAATMVTAGIFLLVTCSHLLYFSKFISQCVGIIGGITSIFGATIAIAQRDIKKIIAYSTISQLGYMLLSCGIFAYEPAMFHLATHAFFKALLFLSAGNVIHACHEQDVFKIGGLRSKMKITYINFWIGSLAIIGIFPLAGFYSKDAILESALVSGNIGYVLFICGIISAMLTAIYSMKIIILVFHNKTKLSQNAFDKVREADKIMNLPLLILSLGAIFSGMIGHHLLHDREDRFFASSILNSYDSIIIMQDHISLWMTLLPVSFGIVGMIIGVFLYSNRISDPINAIYNILRNKYYFDEFYNVIIVRPLGIYARLLNIFDQKIIDGFCLNSITSLTWFFSYCITCLQTGYIAHYVLIMLLAIFIPMTYFVIHTLYII